MKVHSDLYRLCGILDKKEFVWVPHTEHKLVEYRIEPPNYRLWVNILGEEVEFTHPIDQGLDYLRNNINEYLETKKKKRSNIRKVLTAST